jgi:hypothetical protein
MAKVDGWHVGTSLAEPVFGRHPVPPATIPFALNRRRGIAEAFECVGVAVGIGAEEAVGIARSGNMLLAFWEQRRPYSLRIDRLARTDEA